MNIINFFSPPRLLVDATDSKALPLLSKATAFP